MASESSRLLFSDAGGIPHTDPNGDAWIAVTDEAGKLLEARRLSDTVINLAEMEGVILATKYATGPSGVILTDSLDATKFLGGGTKHPYSKRIAELDAARQRLKAALPKGWIVAWIPERFNRAHAPLTAQIRRERARG